MMNSLMMKYTSHMHMRANIHTNIYYSIRTFCTTSWNTCEIPSLVFALASKNSMPLLFAHSSAT